MCVCVKEVEKGGVREHRKGDVLKINDPNLNLRLRKGRTIRALG